MDKERAQLMIGSDGLPDSQYLCPFCNNRGTRKGVALQLYLLIAPILLLLIALLSIA